MGEIVELYRRAVDRFGEKVHAVGEEQWGRPTPCTEWDVRALVRHLVHENLWVPPLFAGQTIAEVGDRFEGDILGSDPKGAWDASAAPAIAAITEPGAMDRTVHLSFGDTPAEEYVWQLFMDFAIHGWDLARGIGSDETMDPEFVEALLPFARRNEADYRAGGSFGPRVEVLEGADEQAVLLAITGRAV